MGRLSFSGQEKSIETTLSWYNDQRNALIDLKAKIIDAIIHSKNTVSIDSKFMALSLDEIDEYFKSSEMELEHLACFDLISATEALLRVDFFKRVYNKDKSAIGLIFRNIYKEKEMKISLERDIIENWKQVGRKKAFSDFLGLLNYRHWLAHGRYWNPKLGRQYSFDNSFEIAENIYQVVSSK